MSGAAHDRGDPPLPLIDVAKRRLARLPRVSRGSARRSPRPASGVVRAHAPAGVSAYSGSRRSTIGRSSGAAYIGDLAGALPGLIDRSPGMSTHHPHTASRTLHRVEGLSRSLMRQGPASGEAIAPGFKTPAVRP